MTNYQESIAVDFWRQWCREASVESVHELLQAKCGQMLPLFDVIRDESPVDNRGHVLDQLAVLVQVCVEITSAALPAEPFENCRQQLERLNQLIAELECIPRTAQRFDHQVRKLEWAVRLYARQQQSAVVPPQAEAIQASAAA